MTHVKPLQLNPRAFDVSIEIHERVENCSPVIAKQNRMQERRRICRSQKLLVGEATAAILHGSERAAILSVGLVHP